MCVCVCVCLCLCLCVESSKLVFSVLWSYTTMTALVSFCMTPFFYRCTVTCMVMIMEVKKKKKKKKEMCMYVCVCTYVLTYMYLRTYCSISQHRYILFNVECSEGTGKNTRGDSIGSEHTSTHSDHHSWTEWLFVAHRTRVPSDEKVLLHGRCAITAKAVGKE